MPKNLGLYNNTLSVPRKKDIDTVQDTVDMHDSDIQQLETDVNGLNTEVSAVKAALTSKQDTITGAGSTITENNLTANRVVVSNASGKVAISDITSTELNYLDNVTSNVQTQLNGKAPTIHTHTPNQITAGYTNANIYIDTHPESNTAILPFINNDLAFLNKKGGSYKVYTTTSTDYTVEQLTETAITSGAQDNMFDGSPSYFILPQGDNVTVIDMTLHKTFPYSNIFYIDFGNTSWRAKNIAIYVRNTTTETNYILKNSAQITSYGEYFAKISHTSTNSSGTTVQGFNSLRVVLSNWNSPNTGSSKRISQVGLISYASDGVKETFISRGGCNGVYGNLVPQTDNNINLGASNKKFANVYANNLVGNASSATTLNGLTATVGELNYTDGVTSNIQTQLDNKVPKTITVNGHALSGNVTVTKGDVGLSNVDNVKQYSASNPPPYPVTSVDGSTGAVVLNDVKFTTQTLTDAQKTQARKNIGAGTSSFSGSYNDLSNKPTIPTVNNGTLTIQKNGTNVATFGANNSANVTANITVPTKTSELTNNSGFITSAPVTSVNTKTGAVVLNASDVGALSTAGGTLTGDLSGKYITGTWLRTTSTSEQSSAATRIAVIDDGWIYYRTPANLIKDLGAVKIVTQAAQPTGQNSGDFWYQVT